MAFKVKESGYAKLGKARRRLIRRNKKTRTMSGGLDALAEVLDTAAGVVTFAGVQKKKYDTAWKEYEAGYEALGGDVADIPKRDSFWKQTGQTLMPGGDKGFYEMPEGEVMIDRKMYDREKIQDAGSFLGTDAAAALYSQEGGDKARERYLERVVPGKVVPEKLAPGLGTAPATEPYMLPIRDEYGAVGGTDYSMRNVDERSFVQKITDWGIPVTSAVAGAGLAATGAVAPGLALMGPMWGKMAMDERRSEKYTDKQRQPYMENPRRSLDDTWKRNNGY